MSLTMGGTANKTLFFSKASLELTFGVPLALPVQNCADVEVVSNDKAVQFCYTLWQNSNFCPKNQFAWNLNPILNLTFEAKKANNFSSKKFGFCHSVLQLAIS